MDPTLFRELMAGICAPVTVVTTMLDGVPHGTTVSAMMSVSLAPPLVGVSLDASSTILAHARASGRFGINVLAHDQAPLALRFAKKVPEKFVGVEWSIDADLPRLAGALGWMVCALDQAVEAGDHVILLGRLEAGVAAKGPPLVYAHREFGTHSAFMERALAGSASEAAVSVTEAKS